MKKRKFFRQSIILVLALLVGLGITYVMIRPASTLEFVRTDSETEAVMTESNRVQKGKTRRTDTAIPGNEKVLGNVTVSDQTTNSSSYPAEYDKTTGLFSIYFRMDFSMAKSDVDYDTCYIYGLPEDITVSDKLLNGGPYTGVDSNGKDAFRYDFVKNADGTYRIRLWFDEAYTMGNLFEGGIDFYGYAGADSMDENGDIKIIFKDSATVEIKNDQILYPDDETMNYDISVKKGTGVLDQKNKTLTYTVKVSSKKGTPDTITITDVLRVSDLNVTGVNVTSVKVAGVELEKIKPENVSIADGKASFSLTLPGLEPEQEYVITYVYQLESLPDSIATTAKNTVTASAKDENTNETVKDEDESSTDIRRGTFSKSGSYDEKTGKITWTITINASGTDIAGKKLTDTMFGEAVGQSVTVKLFDGNKVSEGDGYVINRDDQGNITSITFEATDGQVNKNKYIITYTTLHESTMTEQRIKNSAAFKGMEQEISVNVPADSSFLKKKFDTAGKVDEKGIFTMTWSIDLKVPVGGIPKGTVICDEVKKDSQNYNKAVHWITGSQLDALLKSFVENGLPDPTDSKIAKVEVTTDGYNFSTYAATGKGTEKYVGFRITFLSDVLKETDEEQTFHFSYSTTADCSWIKNVHDYYNTAGYGDIRSEATYTYHVKVVKLNSNGYPSDQTITVDATKDSARILYWYVKVYVDSDDYRYFVVKDTLPDNVEIKRVGIGLDQARQAKNNLKSVSGGSTEIQSDVDVAVSGTASENSGQTVTTWVRGKDYLKEGTTFYICYECQTKDDLTTRLQYEYNNRVEVFTDKDRDEAYGSGECKETVEIKNVQKSGTWGGGNTYLTHYSVTINPYASDLVPGSNTIQLTDTIKYFRDPQYGLVISLKLSSVVLKKVNSDGTREVYDDWKWTYDEQTDGNGNWTNTIKATIPDGMTFVLEYDYKIIYEKLVKPNDAASCTISNNVELAGVSGGKDSISNKFEWENAGTSAWGKTDQGYVFQKVEKDNFGKQLEGAVFTLYREVDGAAVPVEHNGEIVTYRTGSDGVFTITQGSGDSDLRFEEDTLYYVQETEAPTGYELSDQPEKYYFYFSGNGSFSVSAEKKAVNLSKDTYKAFVENAKVENEEEGVYTLPETGGWGTMLFYVLSTMVLIGSGFLLLRNKYMS